MTFDYIQAIATGLTAAVVAWFLYNILERVTRPIEKPSMDEIIERNKDLYEKLRDE